MFRSEKREVWEDIILKLEFLKIHKWQRILWRSPIYFKFEIKKIHLGKKEGEMW